MTLLPSAPREERVVRREEVRVGDLALRREELRLADRRPELLVRRVVEGQQFFQRRLFDNPAALGRVDLGVFGLRALLEEHPARVMLWEAEPLAETAERLAGLGVESVVYAPCANRPREGDWLAVMQANLAAFEALAASR